MTMMMTSTQPRRTHLRSQGRRESAAGAPLFSALPGLKRT